MGIRLPCSHNYATLTGLVTRVVKSIFYQSWCFWVKDLADKFVTKLFEIAPKMRKSRMGPKFVPFLSFDRCYMVFTWYRISIYMAYFIHRIFRWYFQCFFVFKFSCWKIKICHKICQIWRGKNMNFFGLHRACGANYNWQVWPLHSADSIKKRVAESFRFFLSLNICHLWYVFIWSQI